MKDMASCGNYLFATQSAYYPCAAKLSVLDITSLASPSFVNAISLQSAGSLELSGNNAFVAGGSYGLLAIDISDPTNLSIDASYSTPKDLATFSLYGSSAIGVHADLGIYVLSPLSN